MGCDSEAVNCQSTRRPMKTSPRSGPRGPTGPCLTLGCLLAVAVPCRSRNRSGRRPLVDSAALMFSQIRRPARDPAVALATDQIADPARWVVPTFGVARRHCQLNEQLLDLVPAACSVRETHKMWCHYNIVITPMSTTHRRKIGVPLQQRCVTKTSSVSTGRGSNSAGDGVLKTASGSVLPQGPPSGLPCHTDALCQSPSRRCPTWARDASLGTGLCGSKGDDAVNWDHLGVDFGSPTGDTHWPWTAEHTGCFEQGTSHKPTPGWRSTWRRIR